MVGGFSRRPAGNGMTFLFTGHLLVVYRLAQSEAVRPHQLFNLLFSRSAEPSAQYKADRHIQPAYRLFFTVLVWKQSVLQDRPGHSVLPHQVVREVAFFEGRLVMVRN